MGPPLAAFGAATAILILCAQVMGADPFTTAAWFKWDSAWYDQIARHAYQPLTPCTAAQWPGPGLHWCGDGGWFPGYPLLIAAVGAGHLPAVAISWLLDLVTLVVLWNAGGLRDRPSGRLALGFAAFAFGGIYLRAAYPMSAAALAILLCLLALRRHRWLWAGVAGACAAFCYPTALLLAPVVALAARRRAPLAGLAGGALVAVGTAGAMLLMWHGSGRADAYFAVQSHYGHTPEAPPFYLWKLVSGRVHQAVLGSPLPVEIEGVTVALTVVHLAGSVRRLGRWPRFLFGVTLAFWLVPLTQGNVSYWREDSLLLGPVALLLAELPRRRARPVTAAAVLAFPLLAGAFFSGRLI